MMRIHLQSCALALAIAASAHAWRPLEAPSPDRALFDRLVDDIRQLDRTAGEVMDQAMAEARQDYGRVDFTTKARVLSLRDQRDRLHSRLLILSARHGWDLPPLAPRPVRIQTAQETFDSVFGPVDVMVRRRLADEARRIATGVRLPIVSLETPARSPGR